ncbi:right-handed parallel beta-helix repeat-containing protein [Microtetraspora sp. AC03309]|uniref:right-handed parallel beta-helix repeat-containing protein n=1 Tax=Microtetraspora sp. AC03309 TaxID=2779376 RepID=UPI001E2B94D3|nr:right-handed parallel beta-helix repeat-containing protein [Microtetraspora sp. AC03309]MCC5575861.1 right-handed parallel beta-helix repeat-containing protein [Microtetraspora sp. AC03309]
MFQFHVAPSGDDSSPGSAERPFATLERARSAAREASGDVVVHLRAGTHVLSGPLELTEADSGVVYQAYGFGTSDQEEAVVSGGRRVEGWRERDGVWTADVGDLDFRQLYVDGRRASRAGIPGLPGAATPTVTGYVTDSADPRGWRSPGDVEFVYRGVYPWTEARCGVAGVSADRDTTVITMAQPAFAWAAELYNSVWDGRTSSGPGLPTRIENDASFLREPGTFVLDRSRPGRHVLRYLPLPGEDPERAEVVAPVLETLVRAAGTRNVSFRGLVFADATWLRPSRPEGFVHYHGSGYYEGGGVETAVFGEGASVTYPVASASIPACVTLKDVAGVAFENCRFTRLGASGLGISGGSEVSVRGCDLDTLSGGGVSVSGGRDVTIEDTWVHHVGLEYSGSPGISVSGARRCTIARNEIADVPHCGIVLGPGEGARVLRNLTVDTMGVLADGGGIYLSSAQGSSPDDGALVRGNVIEDTRTRYNFGLYTDYGASWVTLEGNVVARADSTAILTVAPPLENVVYRGNFWDADPVGHDSPPAGVTYEGNVTIGDERELNAATAAIRSRAGLLRPRPGSRSSGS